MLLGGVDEAGRGPLAGPVVAAAVVLRDGQVLDGVRDSKKLRPARREALAKLIRVEAVSWSLGTATVSEIDQLNILQASLLAMTRAIQGLTVRPAELLIDGNRCPELDPATAAITRSIVGGDDLYPAISAASILAKVERDRVMLALHQRYPAYGFDRHKGYPTPQHVQALRDCGVTPEHRVSFAPVRRAAAALAGGEVAV